MGDRWYTPENANDAVDTLAAVQGIIGLVRDIASQEKGLHQFPFSEGGQAGLYFLSSFLEDALGDCISLLSEEGEHARVSVEKDTFIDLDTGTVYKAEDDYERKVLEELSEDFQRAGAKTKASFETHRAKKAWQEGPGT